MSASTSTIVDWIDKSLDDLLAAPGMWGSNEAVEMQFLQLLEFRSLVLQPQEQLASPRRVIDAYSAFVSKRFALSPPRPFFAVAQARGLRGQEFTSVLEEFRRIMVEGTDS